MASIDQVVRDVREYRGVIREVVDSRSAIPAVATHWGSVLARIALALAVPLTRLISPTGRSADCAEGRCGALVRSWRIARGLTHAEVAGACALPIGALHVIESGSPDIERCASELLRLAEALDVPLFELVAPAASNDVGAA